MPLNGFICKYLFSFWFPIGTDCVKTKNFAIKSVVHRLYAMR